MTGLPPILREAYLWLPALFIIVSTNASLSWWGRPLGAWRYLVCAYVATAPAFFPRHGSYEFVELGMLNTILTSLTIVSAARLPDFDQAVHRPHPSRWTLFFWMSLPVVSLNPNRHPARKRLRLGLRFLLLALFKRGIWEGCAWGASTLVHLPWALKSTLVILYFVLNLTAFHDLVVGLVHFAGLGVDELFDAPLLSKSPRDFWSRRWNKFINRFALKHVALKVRHRVSNFWLLFSVFFVSGIFHEYFAWGVGGLSRAPGAMVLFFSIQAVAVWAGSKWPLRASAWVTQPLTFVWMIGTAPLFFMDVGPALLDFGYPVDWLPFSEKHLWGWEPHLLDHGTSIETRLNQGSN